MVRKFLLFAMCFVLLPAVVMAQVEVVKMCRQRAFPDNVPAGNYSGITHIGGNEYAVVSDKSETDGFFVFRIEVDSLSGEITDVRNEGFRGDSMRNADCEAIAYLPATSTFFISREADNVIAEYTSEGKATGRQLCVPDIYIGKMGGNYGFESLAYDARSHLFWTINESTLEGDGERANSLNGVSNVLRLQSFGEDMQPAGQFFYKMDAPVSRSVAGNYAMGVSELAAVGDGRLLVLEREFFVPKAKIGAFVRCKLYEVNPGEGQAVAPDGEVRADSTAFLTKRPVCSFTTKLGLFNRSLANYEGMCLGPELADGSRTLILVSDSQNQYAGVLKDWFKTIVIRRAAF